MRILLSLMKWLAGAALLVFLALMIWQRELIIYGLGQLRGQLHVIFQARPVAEVLNDPLFPDSLKVKLRMTQRIRRYAIDRLGMNDSGTYTEIYDQQGKPVLWVITACPPFTMEEHLWKFPILGYMPYKGYFDHARGLAEADRLRDQGLDVSYSPVAGWSTLGWFEEPLLSNMLRRSEGELAELLIHELMHATAFHRGHTDYNENLATFVGERGAEDYLMTSYGSASPQLRTYRELLEDEMTFGTHMLEACHRLEVLYTGFSPDLTDSIKHQLKDSLIRVILEETGALPLHRPERFTYNLQGKGLPGNTYFLGYKRYRKDQQILTKKLERMNGDLREFIRREATDSAG